MMGRGFRANFANAPKVAAVFDEPNGSGAADDINAGRNAPAKDPGAYLSRVTWHIDFFQFELALPQKQVTINHAALAGRMLYYGVSGNGGLINGSTTKPNSFAIGVGGQIRSTQITLYTHNLGYVPVAYVAYAGSMLPAGRQAQAVGGRGRMVSAFATTSIIGLREVAWSDTKDLPAVSRTYDLLICRNPVSTPGQPLFRFDGHDVMMGGGKVDSRNRYLRRVLADESSFDLDRGPTCDFKNGGWRDATGGAVIDGPGYNGSFAGPAYLPVGV